MVRVETDPRGRAALRIGSAQIGIGAPPPVDAYRALLVEAVRLVESRARPEAAGKPADGPGQYRCPECSLVVTPVDPDVERHPPTCVHTEGRGRPVRCVRMVPVPSTPSTPSNHDRIRTTASRIAGLIVDSGLPSRSVEEVEAWLAGTRELTEAEVEECARAGRKVMSYVAPGEPVNVATMNYVRSVIDGTAPPSCVGGYEAAVLARAAELRGATGKE
jgi:hypothetical protein